MFYLIYRITNKVNNKIYIGCHKTKDVDDAYMGSGNLIIAAIKKYGIENFEKEILEVFDNPEQMFEMESKLVNTEFVKRKDTYNLKEGGIGGFDHVTPEQKAKGIENRIKTFKNRWLDLNYRNYYSNKLSTSIKAYYENGGVGSFTGKNHSDETIKKMSETHKKNKNQQGEKNSHYGMIWINHPVEKIFKSIRKEDFSEFEKNGWLKGRSFTTETDLEEKIKKKEELKIKKMNDKLLKEQEVEKLKQEKIIQKQLESENKLAELRKLHEIYKLEGFDGVLATGYKYTKQNLVNQMMHYLPEFVSQNGKKRKNIVK